jgi:hypothetical protein
MKVDSHSNVGIECADSGVEIIPASDLRSEVVADNACKCSGVASLPSPAKQSQVSDPHNMVPLLSVARLSIAPAALTAWSIGQRGEPK